MKASTWRKLDQLARQLVPFTSTFLLVMLGAVPLRVPHLQPISPALPLIAVFYWILYRPDLMPTVAAFVLGLTQDTLSGVPLGIHAAIFVLVHLAVTTQRRFFIGKSFAVLWLGFALVAGGAFFLIWLILTLFYLALPPPTPFALQMVVTIGCFPLLFWGLSRVQTSLIDHG